MPDTVFQYDLKIKSPVEAGEKATLVLNERGDLALVGGAEKLAEQLMRAIVNDNGLSTQVMNSFMSARNLQILINLILRNFRQNQLDVVNNADPNFSGYAIYRLNSGSNTTYTKISPNYVTYKFSDTNLTNGVEYKYALTKAYSNFESAFTETIAATPSAFTSRQEVVIGTDVVAMPGNGVIDFYVVFNPKFMGSELLQDILKLEVVQDGAEPRRYTANVVVQDVRGSQNAITATRQNPTL